MKISTGALALVALLALAQVISGFKIWKKICKPIAKKEHQLILFSGISCQMVLVDPFEPLLKLLNKPIWLLKDSSMISSRRGDNGSRSTTTTSSWSGFEPETTPAPEPAETPSLFNAATSMDSSTPTVEHSTTASSGLAESATIAPDPVQPATPMSVDATSNPPVTSVALAESRSNVQQSDTPQVTETTPVLSERTIQPEMLPSTSSASVEDTSPAEAAASEPTYAPTLAELVVSASTRPPTTTAMPDSVESTPLESLQKDSFVSENPTSVSTSAERMQTLVVSSATINSPAEPIPEPAPSPAPLSHDPSTSEAPLSHDATTSEAPLSHDATTSETPASVSTAINPKSEKINEHFTEAMEPS